MARLTAPSRTVPEFPEPDADSNASFMFESSAGVPSLALQSISAGKAILSIGAIDASRNEGNNGATAFTFAVFRQGNLDLAVSAAWHVTTAGQFLADAADFVGGVLPSGTVDFAPGETNKSITILVAGDHAIETDEAFGVLLTATATDVFISSPFAKGTIVNDDAKSLLSIGAVDAVKSEGDSGATPFIFNVTRQGDLDRTVSAAWHVTTAGQFLADSADFVGGVLPSGTADFAPGETSKSITILVAGDQNIETDEAFGVVLTAAATDVFIASPLAKGKIVNDDVASVLSIGAVNASRSEGNSGTTPFTFNVHRSGDINRTSTVNWDTIVFGNGTLGSDFSGGVLPNGSVTFGAGEIDRAITVLVSGDSSIETDESFGVKLSAPSANTIVSLAVALGTIVNDDAKAVLSIASTDATKLEGDSHTTPFTFTVTRSGDLNRLSSADWSVIGTGGPDVANAQDFLGQVFPSGSVSFASGETSKTVTVSVLGDLAVEKTEAFGVKLSAPAIDTIVSNAVALGSIVNDDLASVVSFGLGGVAQPEGNSGTTAMSFTVSRTGGLVRTDTVHWAVATGGPNSANAADFAGGVLPSGTVTFAPGQTSQVIAVPVAGDFSIEADESFSVNLSNPSPGVNLLFQSKPGTILNDDTKSIVAFTPGIVVQKAEGTGPATSFTYTVFRSGDLDRTDTAGWAVSLGGQNSADSADFMGGVVPSGVVTFAPGQTTQTITVPIEADFQVESDENFAVILSNPSAGVELNWIVVGTTILNDDTQTIVAFTPGLIQEKAEGTGATTLFHYTAYRSGDIDRTDTVDWTVEIGGQNSADSVDFAGGAIPSGLVVFAPGQTTQTITVPISADFQVENDEIFAVVLSNPSVGVQLNWIVAPTTILNDDIPMTLALTPLDAVKKEGDSGGTPFTFTVSRSGDLSLAVDAKWQVLNAGPFDVDAADFIGGALPSGDVSFAPGETSQTIAVLVAGDIAVESDEAFLVNLYAPTNGATLGQFIAKGIVLNDDRPATISIATARSVQPEGDASTTPFTFTVTRGGNLATAVSVQWDTAPDGATPADGKDFAMGVFPSGSIDFAAGQTTQILTVDVSGDIEAENDDGFFVTLSKPSDGADIVGASAPGAILNDDVSRAVIAMALRGQAMSFLPGGGADPETVHDMAPLFLSAAAMPLDPAGWGGGPPRMPEPDPIGAMRGLDGYRDPSAIAGMAGFKETTAW